MSDLLDEQEHIDSSAIADVMSAMGLMQQVLTPKLVPLRPSRMIGRALCVRGEADAGEAGLPTFALDKHVTPGDIVMIDTGGNVAGAIIGENMVTSMARRGARGFMLTGAVRDRADLETGDTPIFCFGAAPSSAHQHWSYVEIGGEITLPGLNGPVIVCTGDTVVADEDGVCVLPSVHAVKIVADARLLLAADKAIKAAIIQGVDRDEATRRHPRLAHVERITATDGETEE